MELILTRIVEAFITPPGLILAMVLIGLLLRRWLYRTGQSLIVGGFVLLWIASMPLVSTSLTRIYESIPPLIAADLKKPQANAIVILGGGRYPEAPEYGKQDTVKRLALERLRYGAYLQRHTGLPILVAGGRVYDGDKVSEAQLMKQTLERDLIAKVRWVEDKSRTTYWNAIDAQTLLAKAGINKIYLVTHARHMPRAKEAFEHAGFTVVPAPMGYTTSSHQPLILKLLPSATALGNASTLMHEVIGQLWYRLRYY